MRVAVVDDEKNMSDLICQFLDRYETETNIITEAVAYNSSRQFAEEYNVGDFDLILLDVEMPELNGIDLAKQIRKLDGDVTIMFITNMAQYAIHGYSVEAIDYVLKPITYEDFAMKMNKASRYIKRNVKAQLMLNTTRGKVPVYINEIYYIEIVRHYLYFHTHKGKYEVRGVMKEMEKQLSEMNFVRCSQSYLVNLAFVKSVKGNDVLVGDDFLPISRNRKTEFMEAFAKYVGGLN